MKRRPIICYQRVLLPLLFVVLSGLTSLGCDKHINVTEPYIPGPEADSDAVLVVGTMTAAQGSCSEATSLFDNKELEGARTECGDEGGCTRLVLESDVFTTRPGSHLVAFKVVEQSEARVEYTIEGEVSAPHDPSSRVPLGPVTAELSPGEQYRFRVDTLPWVRPAVPRPEEP